MKKLLSKIFHILGVAACVLFGLLAVLAVMGYFIGRARFREPVEEYTLVGSRVYARAPAMMVDTSFSAPAVAGLCGALLEWRRMSRAGMVGLLHAAGTNAAAPDCEVGYGIPQTARMHLLP